MSGAWVRDKIDAGARTNGRTSKFVNALGLDWSAFHLSDARHYHHFRSYLYPRNDADTTVDDACFHTTNSADGRLDVHHDSAPDGAVFEDAMETSSFDFKEVDSVSKSYPFTVELLGSPDSLSDAYKVASAAQQDSRYFVERDNYSIAALHLR